MARLGIEIDADYQGGQAVDRAEDDVKNLGKAAESTGKSFRLSFTEINQGLELGSKALATFKKGYEFAREGAALEVLESKFGNLSASIGTTSDVLLSQLKQATAGMISDAQLMAGASDLMELGLAKTQDETILMSELVGKLGLDLQVLGLTIANESTARLDSLGLSMEKVKAQTQAYVDAGFDKHEAFKMSVLDGLQDRLELVGDTADTSLGKFMQFEAATENLGNRFKALATDALLPAVTAAASLTDQLDKMGSTAESNSNGGFKNFLIVLNEINKAVGGIPMDKLVRGSQDAEKAQDDLGKGGKYVVDVVEEQTVAIDEAAEAAAEWAEQYRFNAAVARDNIQEGERYGITAEMIADKDRERAEAAEAAARAAAELTEKQKQLAAATGDYFTKAVQAEDAQFDVNQAIYDAADASGAGATQLAILGGALGLYSEEAVEAALKTALIQAKIDELAAAYVAGDISVNEMRSSLNSFIGGLDNTAASMAGAASEAGALRGELDSIPRDITVQFRSDLSQFELPPNLAQEAATPTSAGPTQGGIQMALGGIVPGMFGQPMPLTAHGGEMVLTPADQTALLGMIRGGGGGKGNVSISVTLQGVTGDNVAGKASRGVLDAARQVGIYPS